MLQREEERAWNVFMEARLIIAKLEDDVNSRQVKGAAAAYWRAARDAEDAMFKHRQCKFALEVPLQTKMNAYDSMIDCLKQLKERESMYKEAVDNANTFLHGDFRLTMDRLTASLIPPLDLETTTVSDKDRSSFRDD